MSHSINPATTRVASAPGTPRAAGRRFIRWSLAMLVVAGAGVFLFVNAARFLEGPATAPIPADFQVVLGGDSGDRVLTAATNYQRGVAPYVVLVGLEHSPVEVRPYYVHWRTNLLVDRGVPRERIFLDSESTSSWEEAVNTLKLMRSKGWNHVVVVSDPYHMRRLSWIWSRVFRDSGLEYTLVSSRPDYWKPDAWWRNERSGAMVIMEYIKLAYYLAKY
jgi:uncharacterized SAM-binding protein YcdF (DUF218 family)